MSTVRFPQDRDLLRYGVEKLSVGLRWAAVSPDPSVARLEGAWMQIHVLRSEHVSIEARERLLQIHKEIASRGEEPFARMQRRTASRLLKVLWDVWRETEGAYAGAG